MMQSQIIGMTRHVSAFFFFFPPSSSSLFNRIFEPSVRRSIINLLEIPRIWRKFISPLMNLNQDDARELVTRSVNVA